jgi:flagellin
MIGGLSSSLALAQRTADRATATMAKVSRQMATGKEVSSARDDGARFVQALALKSQQVTWESRRQLSARIQGGLVFTKAIAEDHQAITNKMREVALAAASHPAGSNARRALQADWDALVAAGKSTSGGTNPFWQDSSTYGSDASGIGMLVGGGDSFWNGTRYAMHHDTSLWATTYSLVNVGGGVPLALDTVDILNGSAGHLTDAMTSAASLSGVGNGMWNGEWLNSIGADERALDQINNQITKNEDRLNAAIGSLTDADMGKLSTQNQNAQVRQQLALDTISRAISAYGNYAGGLLGNAQRTQRGVLA